MNRRSLSLTAMPIADTVAREYETVLVVLRVATVILDNLLRLTAKQIII
jgi:hypothetical protein